MKTIELLDRLRAKPVFGVQDVERIAYCDRNYAKQIISRMKKRKLIKHIRRNVYTTKDNIFVIASNIIYPCYISFWSASYFLGYTEQIVNTAQVAVNRKIKPIKFENYRIKFVPLKYFFGYKKIRTNEGELFIAENEKLLIDAFLRPEECGNFDEIEKIFENAEISQKKLAEYLKKIGSQTIIKRVGYLLEKNKKIDISKGFRLDKNYVILDPFSKNWKNINAKWRVRL